MKIIRLLLLLPTLAMAQTWYNQTDVISNNTIALTNKTIDCNLNTCNNVPSGSFAANTFYVKCVNVAATDTAALAAAATSATANGGTIMVTGNCSINNTTTLPSNTVVSGYGATVAPVASASWVGSVNRQSFILAANATNVTIQGINFSYLNDGNQGACHIIELYSTNSKVLVKDNLSNYCGDFTANIGGTDVLITNNKAYNMANACYDNWNGATNVTITNNFCSILTSGKIGIEFTDENTDTTAAITSGLIATGNTIFELNSLQQGINVDLFATCVGASAQYGTIANNHIYTATGLSGWGILVRFCANNWDIHDNMIVSDGTDQVRPAIQINTTIGSNVMVHNNLVYNWNNSTGVGSAAGLFMNSTPGGTLAFNECYSCTGTLLGTTDATTLVVGNDTGTGAVTFANITATGNIDVGAAKQLDWTGRGILTSPAATVIQLGAADSATPANQTVKAQNSRGGTDTNIAGANLIIASGHGTGNATPSTLTLSAPQATTSGTTAQTFVPQLVLSDPAITFGSGSAGQLIKLQSPLEANGGTAFTVSGCGSAGNIKGGAWGGSFTVGTGTTNCTFTVTINGATGTTAANGWILNMDDTTAGIHCVNSTTVSTTTAVGVCTGTIATSDLIKFTAVAY